MMLVLLPSVVLFSAAPGAAAQATDKTEQAAAIERECGLKKGAISVIGDQIRLQPSQGDAYEKVDCALERLNKAGFGKLGFVGNEADPNAVLEPPLRYIAEGSSIEIKALVTAAKADKWVVNKTATASDGMSLVQFESGAAMTNGQASKLLDRIWKKEFGDIEFGTAPRKLSDPNPFDD